MRNPDIILSFIPFLSAITVPTCSHSSYIFPRLWVLVMHWNESNIYGSTQWFFKKIWCTPLLQPLNITYYEEMFPFIYYFRKHTWVRALKVSVYTGSRDTPLVSAACWIWCSHFRLAQFLRLSIWLLSKAFIRNSTMLSRTLSSLPLSSDTTNSMYLWNCFEDNLTSWPGCGFGNWPCSLAKKQKQNQELTES